MFEGGWGDAEWDAVGDPVESWPSFELAEDDEAAFDEVVVADPGRERSVGEVVAAAEHDLVVSDLGVVDLASCTDDEKLAVMVAAQRRINHFEAVKLAAVAAFAGPEPGDDVQAGRSGAAFAWCEVAGALRLGEGTARSLTHTAQRMVSHLPQTLAAMRSGGVSWPKARTVLDATGSMTREQCRAVEDKVSGEAARRNPSQHTQAVGRAVRAVDPDGWARRREQKLADVALIRRLHGDGVADMFLMSMNSLDNELLWTAADTHARARKAAGDPRPLDALRVAAIVEWAADYLTGSPITRPNGEGSNAGERSAVVPAPPRRNGQPATVNIIIGLPDLLDPAAGGAATIAGCGEPLPAEAVAELLRQGARIRFALVDQHGRLAGISTKLHDPTALQRVFVALRDVTLRVPGGSTTPIAGQDLDHINPDGPTAPGNLHAPSRGWHRAKTFRHWTITTNPDGTITWTSRRTKRSYTTHPYNHRAGP